MANAYRDQNSVPTLIAVSNVDGQTPVRLFADPVTHRLLVDATGGGGSTLAFETPTGAVDDSNTSFVVLNEPLYILVNGAQYLVGTGLYSSYVAGTVTLSSPVGTGGFIRSAYNS